MSGSSWMGSVEDDVHNQDDDLESRISDSLGDTASGRSSLTDAVVSRVVETVRAGVIVTSEDLGDLAADLTSRYERPKQRLEAGAHQAGPQPAARPRTAPSRAPERFQPGRRPGRARRSHP